MRSGFALKRPSEREVSGLKHKRALRVQDLIKTSVATPSEARRSLVPLIALVGQSRYHRASLRFRLKRDNRSAESSTCAYRLHRAVAFRERERERAEFLCAN